MKTKHLSIKELAAFIGVSTDTIRRAVRKGEIPSTRVRTAFTGVSERSTDTVECEQYQPKSSPGSEESQDDRFPFS